MKAFPFSHKNPTSGLTVSDEGMELRDYFACQALSNIKANIKALETQEEALQTLITGYMGEAGGLATIDGKTLATWKSAKASIKFDAKLFESAMPDIYEQFKRPIPGSRRFLLK